MEQIIPQSKVGNKSAAYRRMGWFMAVILVLVLCAAGSLAWFNINMAETSLKQDVERRLQFTAQNKANALSLWFNSMQNQANRLISADLFRLFASEVNGLGNDLSPLLKASGDSPSGNDDLSQLASQLPLMKNLLQEFISYSGFLRARITMRTPRRTFPRTSRPRRSRWNSSRASGRRSSRASWASCPCARPAMGWSLIWSFPSSPPSMLKTARKSRWLRFCCL